MRISDWSSDVCSSDLERCSSFEQQFQSRRGDCACRCAAPWLYSLRSPSPQAVLAEGDDPHGGAEIASGSRAWCRRSEEHTSELQSLMRISYAVFCLKNKKTENQDQ